MQSLEEKRVYGDRSGATEAFVGCGVGVLRVSVADTGVGEFGLWQRCRARDVAASADAVAIATDEDVLVRRLERGTEGGDGTDRDGGEETGFGPAVAATFHRGDLLAAGTDGRLARRPAGANEWVQLAPAGDFEVRALDGDLAATDDGVYRLDDDRLHHAGLEDVRDVSAPGIPLAATGSALYALGNGWIDARQGAFDAVAADRPSEPGRLARAHAIAGDAVYEHVDGDWLAVEGIDERVVDVAYGEGTYAVTEGGRLLTRGETEWRSQPLGVDDARAIAIPSVHGRREPSATESDDRLTKG